MTTADEYRQYANECLRFADEAETDDLRQSFLDMARDWTLAAMRIEGALHAAQSDLAAPADQQEARWRPMARYGSRKVSDRKLRLEAQGPLSETAPRAPVVTCSCSATIPPTLGAASFIRTPQAK
jgi:hypothetical protein